MLKHFVNMMEVSSFFRLANPWRSVNEMNGHWWIQRRIITSSSLLLLLSIASLQILKIWRNLTNIKSLFIYIRPSPIYFVVAREEKKCDEMSNITSNLSFSLSLFYSRSIGRCLANVNPLYLFWRLNNNWIDTSQRQQNEREREKEKNVSIELRTL